MKHNTMKTPAIRMGLVLGFFGAMFLGGGAGGCDGFMDVVVQKPTVKLVVTWPQLSRNVSQKAILAPGSARTAVIRLTGAAVGGGNFEFTIQRPTDTTEAVAKAYESAQQVISGTYPLWIGFYTSSGDVMGSLVGEVYDTVTIKWDGTGIGDVAVLGKVARVEIPKGQSVTIGTNKELAYTVKNASGDLVAVDRSSVFWSMAEGEEYLSFLVGEAVGIQHGTAKVVATVDGVASGPIRVQVIPVARGMLIPLIPGAPEGGISEAKAVSADGKVVIGYSQTGNGEFHAFRWTQEMGTQDLGLLEGFNKSEAAGMSSDGSVVVGMCAVDGQPDSGVACIWQIGTGVTAIDGFPDGTIWSAATGVSGDGKAVIGVFEINEPDEEMVGIFGFRWTQEEGMKYFSDLLMMAPRHECNLLAISPDGNVIVGSAGFAIDNDNNPIVGPVRLYKVGDVWNINLLDARTAASTGKGEAYCLNADGSVVGGWVMQPDGFAAQPLRWTLTSGLTYPALSRLLVTQTCSADGAMMAGSGGDPGDAFMWDIYRGYRNVYDVLQMEGLLDDIQYLSPMAIMGMSADGQTMVGICGGSGTFRAFLVNLPFVPDSFIQP